MLVTPKESKFRFVLGTSKSSTFYDRQPGERSHWSGEAVGPWKSVAPTKVVEVAMIISVTSAFVMGAPSFECAKTNCRRTAYSSKWSNTPRSRT